MIQQFLKLLGYLAVGLVITLLPESAKRNEHLRPYVSTGLHVASGVLETAVATLLFFAGFLAYVGAFNATTGYTFLSNMPALGVRDLQAMGALGYISFLFTPLAWVCIWCFLEGLVRALDAVFSSRYYGIAFVAVPWRITEALTAGSKRVALEIQLGPARPDEVIEPEAASSGMLEIYARDDKMWSELQVIEYNGHFYQLASKRLVRRGGWHCWEYALHRLEEREVLRGRIIRYDPRHAVPPPSLPPPAPPSPA